MIRCENLSLGYGNHIVIENLSFEVKAGEYLCIIGENGAGKSTLIKTLLNLQKSLRGKIIFDIKAGELGYLPQQTQIKKDFPASVEEIVLSGCLSRKIFPFYSADDKKIAKSNMQRLKIAHLAKNCFRELSGGQQQRVLLARALCAAQKILFLDEPTASLDPNAVEGFYKVISELNHNGITIIMISHNVNSIKYSTHVLKLGKNRFFGSKEAYLCLKH